jgi:hypothetical protein
MSPAGFGPSLPASERPQTHTFDDAATGVVAEWQVNKIKKIMVQNRF